MEAGLLLALRAVSSAAAVNDGSGNYPGAYPPPPGVTPNIENPEDAGRIANIAGLVVCIVLVTLLFAVRIWVKVGITKSILVEDVTCAIAWVCILLYSATVFVMVRNGEGYHSWDVSPEDYSQMLKWLYASSIIYCPTAYFTKVTLLLLIARVFAIRKGVSRALHIFTWGLLVAYLPIQAVKIVICNPIRSYWDPSVDGHCLQQRKVFVSDLCLAIITDLVILLVPIPLTWKLRMSWQRKLKIVFLLGAGGAATGTTIFRLYKVIEFQKSKDVASDFVLLDLLTIIEVTTGLICACLPAANILLEHYLASHGSEPCATAPSIEKRGGSHGRRLTWGGLGTTTMSQHLDSSSTGLDTARSKAKVHDRYMLGKSESMEASETAPTNFDLELAMLTRGSDIDDAHGDSTPACPPQGRSQALTALTDPEVEDWFVIERVTSSDGRKEGWLGRRAGSAGSAGSAGASHEEATEADREAPSESRTADRVSMELARVSGNRPWTRIWDGKANVCPSMKTPTP